MLESPRNSVEKSCPPLLAGSLPIGGIAHQEGFGRRDPEDPDERWVHGSPGRLGFVWLAPTIGPLPQRRS